MILQRPQPQQLRHDDELHRFVYFLHRAAWFLLCFTWYFSLFPSSATRFVLFFLPLFLLFSYRRAFSYLPAITSLFLDWERDFFWTKCKCGGSSVCLSTFFHAVSHTNKWIKCRLNCSTWNFSFSLWLTEKKITNQKSKKQMKNISCTKLINKTSAKVVKGGWRR